MKGHHFQLAGLGEKRVTLNAYYSEMEDIYEELMFQFQKLRNGGGGLNYCVFQRVQGNCCRSPESGYTVSYLRAVVHHAKIYIRPMQIRLCTEPQECQVSEKLYGTHVIILNTIIHHSPLIYSHSARKNAKRGRSFPVTTLLEHVAQCNRYIIESIPS